MSHLLDHHNTVALAVLLGVFYYVSVVKYLVGLSIRVETVSKRLPTKSL